MTRPLPCPFCGKPPRVTADFDFGFVLVDCPNYRCRVVVECEGATEAEAIRRWNRRAPKEAKK